jgi:hypothetical protein
VEEMNHYHHLSVVTLDAGHSPLRDVTVKELCLFLAIIVQMGHDQRDVPKDYWPTQEQFYMVFYGNAMK